MKFDTKEDAVVRAVTFDDIVTGDTTLAGQFRVRFTDGALFAWRTPAMADLKPLELASVLREVATQIINRYGGKP